MGQYKTEWNVGSGGYKEYRNRTKDEIPKAHVRGQQSLETHAKRDGFYSKYGITSEDLAIQEGVSSTALNMRHMNYGSVWQRKAKPTEIERVYNKTIVELAHELGCHPVTIIARHKRYGDVYRIRYCMVEDDNGKKVKCKGGCGKKTCNNGMLEHSLKGKTMHYEVIQFPECNDLRETRKDATAEYKIMFDKYVKKIPNLEWHYIKRNKQGGYDLWVKELHEVDTHWTELPKYANCKFWLHENHPDYPHKARKGL